MLRGYRAARHLAEWLRHDRRQEVDTGRHIELDELGARPSRREAYQPTPLEHAAGAAAEVRASSLATCSSTSAPGWAGWSRPPPVSVRARDRRRDLRAAERDRAPELRAKQAPIRLPRGRVRHLRRGLVRGPRRHDPCLLLQPIHGRDLPRGPRQHHRLDRPQPAAGGAALPPARGCGRWSRSSGRFRLVDEKRTARTTTAGSTRASPPAAGRARRPGTRPAHGALGARQRRARRASGSGRPDAGPRSGRPLRRAGSAAPCRCSGLVSSGSLL